MNMTRKLIEMQIDTLTYCGILPIPRTIRSLLPLVRCRETEKALRALSRRKKPLSGRAATFLALWAMDCDVEVLRAVLDHAPEPARFPRLLYPNNVLACRHHSRLPLWEHPSSYAIDVDLRCGLVTLAARLGKVGHLDELLRRGFDPNDCTGSPGSMPLTAAFYFCKRACVERLLDAPGLDKRLTRGMVLRWAEIGMPEKKQMTRLCRDIAPRLLPPDCLPPTGGRAPANLPIPREITADLAAAVHNWPLAIHLCRRGGLTDETADGLLEHMRLFFINDCILDDDVPWFSWSQPLHSLLEESIPTPRQFISLLDALFTACPRLVNSPQGRVLLFLAACVGKKVSPKVSAWLEHIPCGPVHLPPYLDFFLLCRMLPLWRERLGTCWRPCMDPNDIYISISSVTFPSRRMGWPRLWTPVSNISSSSPSPLGRSSRL